MRLEPKGKPERRAQRRSSRNEHTSAAGRAAPRARSAVTSRAQLIQLLNDILARELGGALRYRLHHSIARSTGAEPAARQLMLHAQAEELNSDELARRIIDLGGKPEFRPDESVLREATGVPAGSLNRLLADDLAGSQRAIEGCLTVLRCVNGSDEKTTQVLRGVVRSELAQAAMLSHVLESSFRPRAAH